MSANVVQFRLGFLDFASDSKVESASVRSASNLPSAWNGAAPGSLTRGIGRVSGGYREIRSYPLGARSHGGRTRSTRAFCRIFAEDADFVRNLCKHYGFGVFLAILGRCCAKHRAISPAFLDNFCSTSAGSWVGLPASMLIWPAFSGICGPSVPVLGCTSAVRLGCDSCLTRASLAHHSRGVSGNSGTPIDFRFAGYREACFDGLRARQYEI